MGRFIRVGNAVRNMLRILLRGFGAIFIVFGMAVLITNLVGEFEIGYFVFSAILAVFCGIIASLLFRTASKLKRITLESKDCRIVAEVCLEKDEIQQINETDVEYVDGMEGHEFEYFCAKLLEKNGFSDVHVTQGSGDQGVDVVAVKDDIKYAIQCKNYTSKLGNTPVQEVSAGKIYYNCDIGVVLTNSTFTPGAIELAKATNIRLWDRDVLQKLMTTANEKR